MQGIYYSGMQWVRSLFRTTRRLVGTDLDGNKYYEILQGIEFISGIISEITIDHIQSMKLIIDKNLSQLILEINYN